VNLGVATLLGSVLPVPSRAQSGSSRIVAVEFGPLTLLRGSGCNVVAMPGQAGALAIDGGLRERAADLYTEILRVTGNDRIDTLVNTHWHPEQTGINELVGQAGGTILAHEKTALFLANTVYSELIDGRREALPEVARPTSIVREDGSLDFGGQRIDYGYLPAAHTDGDIYVHFADLNVLVAGGVVSAQAWPLIDYRSGAWYGGRVRALEWLAELVSADTTVIPAHGAPMTGADIVRHRNIYQSLFETLIAYMNRGFGPEDVVERNPLAAYTAEFGDASVFLDGAYRSMLIAYVPD
jgi:glyoxylase-like metal-dependent hydrolase (beta-lactamase superfamily II)